MKVFPLRDDESLGVVFYPSCSLFRTADWWWIEEPRIWIHVDPNRSDLSNRRHICLFEENFWTEGSFLNFWIGRFEWRRGRKGSYRNLYFVIFFKKILARKFLDKTKSILIIRKSLFKSTLNNFDSFSSIKFYLTYFNALK